MTLTKAWAAKQELGEESEPKAPELVREKKKRKAVKTIECAQVSPAKPKKPKFSDAIDVTDMPSKEPLHTYFADLQVGGEIIGAFRCFNDLMAMKRPTVKSNHFCRPCRRMHGF